MPVLWILAIQHLRTPFVILPVAAWLTDAVDGTLARQRPVAVALWALAAGTFFAFAPWLFRLLDQVLL